MNSRKRKRPFGSSVDLSAYRDQHFKVCVYDTFCTCLLLKCRTFALWNCVDVPRVDPRVD